MQGNREVVNWASCNGHRHIRIKGMINIAKVLVVFCYGSNRCGNSW